jgi:hypothetical protein
LSVTSFPIYHELIQSYDTLNQNAREKTLPKASSIIMLEPLQIESDLTKENVAITNNNFKNIVATSKNLKFIVFPITYCDKQLL